VIGGRAWGSGLRGRRADGRCRWQMRHYLIAPIPPESPAVETNRPTHFRGAHLDGGAPVRGRQARRVAVGTWSWGRRHSPEAPNMYRKNTSGIPLGQTGGSSFTMISHCACRAHATACRRTQPAPSGRWAGQYPRDILRFPWFWKVYDAWHKPA